MKKGRGQQQPGTEPAGCSGGGLRTVAGQRGGSHRTTSSASASIVGRLSSPPPPQPAELAPPLPATARARSVSASTVGHSSYRKLRVDPATSRSNDATVVGGGNGEKDVGDGDGVGEIGVGMVRWRLGVGMVRWRLGTGTMSLLRTPVDPTSIGGGDGAVEIGDGDDELAEDTGGSDERQRIGERDQERCATTASSNLAALPQHCHRR
uniref:Uncharacterized protein n=1 Tax=Oryza punctata TaxID=4537 RepID=A0A0E0JS40_ORYPU